MRSAEPVRVVLEEAELRLAVAEWTFLACPSPERRAALEDARDAALVALRVWSHGTNGQAAVFPLQPPALPS